MAAGAMVKTAIQKVGGGALIGDAVNILGGVSDYKNARKEGNSKAMSLAKSVGTFAFYEMMGPWGLAVAGIQIAGSLGGAAIQHTGNEMRKAYGSAGKFGSGYFNMSEAGYTMRQRSLNAIRSNGLNKQSALGNEARTYYRGSI
jgi:hypothetical protein